MQTIVIGHKNPDMDSICAAVGYARLKQLLGHDDVIAARCGNTNPRVDYVLNRFGVPAPDFISDVSPRVSDVMERNTISVRNDSTVYDAIHLIEERQLRGLPVLDEHHRCLGLLSASRISHFLFPPREEAGATRIIFASPADIVTTIGGAMVTGEVSTVAEEHMLMVGAMNTATSAERLRHHSAGRIIFFTGNRDEVQRHAIQSRVRAIVVTGGMPVRPDIQQAARDAGVPIVSSPHDTATSVLLARGAVQVSRMVDTEFERFSPETPLDAARERATNSSAVVFTVLDEEGVLLGVLSKSDFIKTVPRRLILVDHNELAQAVTGADKVPIVEILDHHRLGGVKSETPIHFWNNPVGSTSTIVALCYQQLGVAVPREIAGLLMAGLISDTLNLTSPTATPTDQQVLGRLATITQVDPAELAREIFSVGSPLLTLTPEQVVTADCKEYEDRGRRFTVSQVEELNFSHFEEKQADLLSALDRHCTARGLFFATLLVTDINTQNSLLLVAGSPAFQERITFPTHHAHIWQLDGVVSRKKQLLPYLLQCLAGVPVR
jgi:manganese-dependent inorganic pyrophosphatase